MPRAGIERGFSLLVTARVKDLKDRKHFLLMNHVKLNYVQILHVSSSYIQQYAAVNSEILKYSFISTRTVRASSPSQHHFHSCWLSGLILILEFVMSSSLKIYRNMFPILFFDGKRCKSVIILNIYLVETESTLMSVQNTSGR